jgi:Flp pilus assembly pilin Flp
VPTTKSNKAKRSKSGQTLVEYGLIVGFASLVVLALLSLLGNNIVQFFSKVTNTLKVAG